VQVVEHQQDGDVGGELFQQRSDRFKEPVASALSSPVLPWLGTAVAR
jgi:hypothetical protein